MCAAREAWFVDQLDLDPERIVFIDEIAATTNMVRRCGRAPRGQRCRVAVPHGHSKTTTVTAALRASGPFAIELMDGAANGLRFRARVADVLVPALRPGDAAVMDNLAARKLAGIRQLIEAAGARLPYLPSYSPIENASAELKALPRTAAARTVPDLWAAEHLAPGLEQIDHAADVAARQHAGGPHPPEVGANPHLRAMGREGVHGGGPRGRHADGVEPRSEDREVLLAELGRPGA